MAATGQRCAYHLASPAEYPALLRAKLLEEAHEATTAPPSELLAELGDVLQVLYALAEAGGHSPAEVEHARARKTATRGGFARGVVWHGPLPNEKEVR